MVYKILLVAAGGAAGSVARCLISNSIGAVASVRFPLGTVVAALYAALSLALGIMAAAVGMQIVRMF